MPCTRATVCLASQQVRVLLTGLCCAHMTCSPCGSVDKLFQGLGAGSVCVWQTTLAQPLLYALGQAWVWTGAARERRLVWAGYDMTYYTTCCSGLSHLEEWTGGCVQGVCMCSGFSPASHLEHGAACIPFGVLGKVYVSVFPLFDRFVCVALELIAKECFKSHRHLAGGP